VPGGIQGWRVALADDAVNAGTAIRACATELQNSGAVPVAVAALLALGPAEATVRDTMGLPLYAAAQLNSRAWPAATCPLCASGVPLDEARWEP
jgi:orotate phosphoribosyltransferase